MRWAPAMSLESGELPPRDTPRLAWLPHPGSQRRVLCYAADGSLRGIMVLRLVIASGGASHRHALVQGDNLVGSDPGCAVHLSDPTVSRRHALIRIGPQEVSVEDLGSRNGTFLDGRRVGGKEVVEKGAELGFGLVKASLEEVDESELEAAVIFDPPPEEETPTPHSAGAATASIGSLKAFALDHLPRLLARVNRGQAPVEVAQAVGAALFETLPCRGVEVVQTDGPESGVVFSAGQAGEPAARIEARAADSGMAVSASFLHPDQGAAWRPLVEVGARLIELAVEAPPPDAEAVPGQPSLPDPPTVVPTVRQLYADAARVARGDVSVLILGESGTGKEVLARFIHAASLRSGGPFVALNCAALPRDLLEAELFGIEKGVATGVTSRPGRFETASGGTLFLDEIADMAAETQARILRVLQEGEVYRLGAREPRPAHVRVISASNRDIEAMLTDGGFRTDLYHRIADWTVQLPPLRDRRADIPSLAAYFLHRETHRRGVRPGGISRAALQALERYGWPGNIRQLEREMARAALFLDDGQLLETRHLQARITTEAGGDAARGLRQILEAVERTTIEQTLAELQGDTAAAAERLGISRSTLYRRMKELGISPPGVKGS